MIPHEKAMVERLKSKPFALIGINSDGDRDVLEKLDEGEIAALKAIGKSEREVVEKIRACDPEVLAQAQAVVPDAVRKIRAADLAALRGILDKSGITWRQAVQGSTAGPLPTRWNVSGWPTIYVLDAEGRIRYRDLRDEELENAVVKLLSALPGKKGG